MRYAHLAPSSLREATAMLESSFDSPKSPQPAVNAGAGSSVPAVSPLVESGSTQR